VNRLLPYARERRLVAAQVSRWSHKKIAPIGEQLCRRDIMTNDTVGMGTVLGDPFSNLFSSATNIRYWRSRLQFKTENARALLGVGFSAIRRGIKP
jgi:hypothetical protein